MTSTVLIKHGKNHGIAVYVTIATILKEMAAKIVGISQHFFFVLVQELSDSTSYVGCISEINYSNYVNI
jgi:hypothetical protein